MEEMLDDTLESLDEDEELEEEADAEVDKVLYELTDGKLGLLDSGSAVPGLPVSPKRSLDLHSSMFRRAFGSSDGGAGELIVSLALLVAFVCRRRSPPRRTRRTRRRRCRECRGSCRIC